jgi:hypothetical protein
MINNSFVGQTTMYSNKIYLAHLKDELLNYSELETRPTNLINLVSEGADNTGAKDISTILQNKINSSPDAPITIYFPQGIYKLDKKVSINRSNITLLGSSATIEVSKNVYHESFLWDTSSIWENIVIDGIHFKGVLANEGQGFIKFQGATNVIIQNCTFESCGGAAIANGGGDILDKFVCRNCKFITTNDAGLLLRPLTNALIYDNYFEQINGYSSSTPAHPIYLRADGNNTHALENIFIYNNVIHSCNIDDFGGKSAIKVVSNKTYSPDYIGKNIYIVDNKINDWTFGVHISRINEARIENNIMRLVTEIGGSGVMAEECEDVLIVNNDIETHFSTENASGSKLYTRMICIAYSSNVQVLKNRLTGKSYYGIHIVGYTDTDTNTEHTKLSDYNIVDNIIEHSTDKMDGYTIFLSADMQNVNISGNKISCGLRGIHCGSNIFSVLAIRDNTFTHLIDETGSGGVALSSGNATKTNYTQAGNTIFGFATANASEYDITENNSFIDKTKVTPEMFGAVGDNETDNTEALQQMFDYASTNNCYMHFPMGKTYRVFNTIYLDEEKQYVLRSDSSINSAENNPHIRSGVSDLILFAARDFESRTSPAAINIQCENITIRAYNGVCFKGMVLTNCLFEHCKFQQIGTWLEGGLHAYSKVSNCIFMGVQKCLLCNYTLKDSASF